MAKPPSNEPQPDGGSNGDSDAKSNGGKKNANGPAGWLRTVWDTVQTIVIAVAVAFAFRVVLYEPFNIPSGSMLPTLKIGDYLFVSKFSYGYGKYSFPLSPVDFEGRIFADTPERGDVAVFRKPTDTDVDFIKRVVGLPGDRIQVIRGVLHINGEAVERRPIEDYAPDRGEGLRRPAAQYIEVLPNGVSHRIIEQSGDRGPRDNTPELTVPPGHYFVMGDNRDNSTDSRVLSQVGFVPIENFIGEATIIFFSWGPSGPRFGRLFDAVD